MAFISSKIKGGYMIFTLDTRGNIQLEVMQSYFNLSADIMYNEINLMLDDLKIILKSKGVKYEDLKSALIPVHGDKQELILVFDSSKIDNSFYGGAIFEKLIPLLCKESSYSVLLGDLISQSLNQKIMYDILFENLEVINNSEYYHSSQYFCVYINNLSQHRIKVITRGLESQNYFVGYITSTYSNKLKILLAYTLAHSSVISKGKVIQGHEPDRDNSENINMSGYPYEEHGFDIISISSDLFELFLSYKIEAISDGKDNSFSFNAIMPVFTDVLDFQFIIGDGKWGYLSNKEQGKGEIMDMLGILDYTSTQVEHLVKSKIKNSYLYNLEYRTYESKDKGKVDEVAKFDLSFELPTKKGDIRKMRMGVKADISNKKLQLLTMY